MFFFIFKSIIYALNSFAKYSFNFKTRAFQVMTNIFCETASVQYLNWSYKKNTLYEIRDKTSQ